MPPERLDLDRGLCRVEVLGQRQGALGRDLQVGPVDAVHHQAGQRHALFGQPVDEVGRLAEGVALRRWRRPGTSSAPRPAAGRSRLARCRKPPKIASKAATKVCRSVSSWPPRTFFSARRDQVEAHADQPERSAGAGQQHPQEAAVQQRAEVLGRVQEVQRRPGRRGVDHDQVPAAVVLGLRVQLTELLHRHVLLRARERRRQRLVERVLQDRLRALGRASAPPRPRRRSASCPASWRPGCRRRRVSSPLHRTRGVVQLADAERLRQPAGRVDGQHDHLAPRFGGAQGQRRRRGRLAHPARAADTRRSWSPGRRSSFSTSSTGAASSSSRRRSSAELALRSWPAMANSALSSMPAGSNATSATGTPKVARVARRRRWSRVRAASTANSSASALFFDVVEPRHARARSVAVGDACCSSLVVQRIRA